MKNEMTVGRRAAEEIRARAYPDPCRKEMNALGISYDCYSKWRSGKTNPDAYALEKLARAGYDIAYLLTGEKTGETVCSLRCSECYRREDLKRARDAIDYLLKKMEETR